MGWIRTLFVPLVVILHLQICISPLYGDALDQFEDLKLKHKSLDSTELTGVLPDTCPIGPALADNHGRRTLVLIVGVQDYKNYNQEATERLTGPVNDAFNFNNVLTSKWGFEVPTQNICILNDSNATSTNFLLAFERALYERVESSDDIIIIYRAGHGSQSIDSNGDEDDKLDETFLLYDREFIDDEYYKILKRIHNNKTKNIILVEDTCNSGSPYRDPSMSNFQLRSVKSSMKPLDNGVNNIGFVDRDNNIYKFLPGITVLSASIDGQSALERNGNGIFTSALIKALRDGQSITYRQLILRINQYISEENSPQISQFIGDQDKYVFGNSSRSTPFAWHVIRNGKKLMIQGVPISGADEGAYFRIFDSSLVGADLRDPMNQKATVRISKYNIGTGLAEACLPDNADGVYIFDSGKCGDSNSFKDNNGRRIKTGDIAILVKPADKYNPLCFQFSKNTSGEDVPEKLRTQIINLITKEKKLADYLSSTCNGSNFIISKNKNYIVIKDSEGKARNSFKYNKNKLDNLSNNIIKSLLMHERQIHLLGFTGEGGSIFEDDKTISVKIKKRKAPEGLCCTGSKDINRTGDGVHYVSLCDWYTLDVSYNKTNTSVEYYPPLNLYVLILFSDGTIVTYPKIGMPPKEIRADGEKYPLDFALRAGLPLGAMDHILVIGTQKDNTINWPSFSLERDRNTYKNTAMNPIERVVFDDSVLGLRNSDRTVYTSGDSDTAWTMSRVMIQVSANQNFEDIPNELNPPTIREYTIPNFDLKPYLPLDTTNPLYNLLVTADKLEKLNVEYKQHKWDKSTDQNNIKSGLDCSRAVWFAFTRAGLKYNNKTFLNNTRNHENGAYITTSEMAEKNGVMSEYFYNCNITDLKIGDVLVYRDSERGDGHTVIVVDPLNKIAWGSHGWDGNSTINPKLPFENGVQYQKIKFKPDWIRWDRPNMQLAACWRHKSFKNKHSYISEYESLSTGKVCIKK